MLFRLFVPHRTHSRITHPYQHVLAIGLVFAVLAFPQVSSRFCRLRICDRTYVFTFRVYTHMYIYIYTCVCLRVCAHYIHCILIYSVCLHVCFRLSWGPHLSSSGLDFDSLFGFTARPDVHIVPCPETPPAEQPTPMLADGKCHGQATWRKAFEEENCRVYCWWFRNPTSQLIWEISHHLLYMVSCMLGG